MLCVDTSFLIDYLNGETAAEEWLTDHEHQPIHAPTVALFEIYRGVLRADLPGGLDSAADALDWMEPLAFTAGAARETARVEHELRNDGEQINFVDRLIAGICRHHGARLVTRDGDFTRVDGLTVERFDDSRENEGVER